MGIIQSVLKSRRRRLGGKQISEYLVSEDISNGREHNKLPAVSYRNFDRPPSDYQYVTEFVQFQPIDLNESLGIMSACSCVGDCRDELEPCGCSTTIKGKLIYDKNGLLSEEYPLELPDVIRECNSACKCNRKQCKNMVIQRGSKGEFVLFRTKNRGWGIRTMTDLKRGAFVGIYSGELIPASQCSSREDDTYLFNLSGSNALSFQKPVAQPVLESEQEAQSVLQDNGENVETVIVEEFFEPVTPDSSGTASTTASSRRSDSLDLGQDGEPQPVELEPHEALTELENGCTLTEEDSKSEQNDRALETELKSHVGSDKLSEVACGNSDQQQQETRRSEESFVCDAKFYGNFTRFINHSCAPNVIGIKSLTTHQDFRFPYIAFFANRDISPNEELTLNYGDIYWIVKYARDKVFCLCKQPCCRFTKDTIAKTVAAYEAANEEPQISAPNDA